MPPEVLKTVNPKLVVPLVAYLCHESCEESGSVFEVGGGFVAKLRWQRAEVCRLLFRVLFSIPTVCLLRMSPRNGKKYVALIEIVTIQLQETILSPE